MSHIVERTQGTTEVRWNSYLTGTRKQQTVPCATRAVAHAVQGYLAENGERFTVASDPNIGLLLSGGRLRLTSEKTLRDVINSWLSAEDRTENPGSIKVYEDQRDSCGPYLDQRVVSLDLKDLKELNKYLETDAPWRGDSRRTKGRRGYGHTTRLGIMRLVSNSLRLAQADGIIATNPAARLKLPKVKVQAQKHLTPQQYGAIRTHAESDETRLMFDLVLLTGCRISELVTLQVGHVERIADDFLDLSIESHVRKDMSFGSTKGGVARLVSVGGVVASRLIEHIAGRPFAEPLFKSGRFTLNGQMWTTSGWRHNRWDKAVMSAVQAGDLEIRSGEKPTPHWLRHSMATWAIDANEPISGVSKFLGHQAVSTTLESYVKAMDKSRAQIAKTMARLVSDQVA